MDLRKYGYRGTEKKPQRGSNRGSTPFAKRSLYQHRMQQYDVRPVFADINDENKDDDLGVISNRTASTFLSKEVDVSNASNIMISGVRLSFPYKPYPSQLAMMGKIIKALSESKNAILESPTGTGKTLTLLTAAFAWFNCHKDNILAQRKNAMEEKLLMQKVEESPVRPKSETPESVDRSPARQTRHDADAEVVYESPEKKAKIDVSDDAAKQKIPKIYVLSRTHKQLRQMINELRTKTLFRPKISTLGSRAHYCINDALVKSTNKNDDCRKLVKEEKCPYYSRSDHLACHKSIAGEHENALWDMEDLIKAGKNVRACPFYAARDLHEAAEVVFIPYNYLIDPQIRSRMGIDLKGAVLIIDEAHNIEDVCMSSGSFDATKSAIADAKLATKTLSETNPQGYVEQYRIMNHFLDMIHRWTTNFGDDKFDINEYGRLLSVRDPFELPAILCAMGVTSETFPAILSAWNDLKAKRTTFLSDPKNDPSETISDLHVDTISGLMMVFSFMFIDGCIKDYLFLYTRTETSHARGNYEYVYTLSFWCLNPAVVFNEIQQNVRSVILTSGTLSPLGTFSGELGTTFPFSLEAPHVIKDGQLWVGALSASPNNTRLYGVYNTFETLEYQDGLGESIFCLSKTIPEGVLVFLPSYTWLDTLIKRWASTDLYRKLASCKAIFREPRNKGKGAIDELIKEYDESCLKSGGAIMFCVYRGNMSEGIDFADHRCRGVICVGVPSPSTKCPRIIQKKKYNSRHAFKQNLLNGDEWYTIQAYRALNQALGRCIRHRNDWGAIVFLEARLIMSENTKYVSKWVRSRITPWNSFFEAQSSLTDFIENQKVAQESAVVKLAVLDLN